MKLRTSYSLIILALVLGVSLIFTLVTQPMFQRSIQQVARAQASIATPVLQHQLQWHANALINVLVQNLINPLYRLDVTAIQELVDSSLRAELDILEVQVFDAGGVLVCGGKPGALSLQPVPVDPAWLAAMGDGKSVLRDHPDGVEVLMPVNMVGEPLGGVRLLFSTDTIQRIINETQTRIMRIAEAEGELLLWLAVLILVLLSLAGVLLALVVARHLEAPIQQLIAATRALRDGDLSTPVQLARQDEFGALAATLDHLRLNVVRSYEELRQKNEELLAHQAEMSVVANQKAVAEATAAAKGLFLATMSHEIRTPMNVVIGMGDVLMESGLNDEQRGYVDKLQQAGASLLELINQILDLSKIETGQLTIVEAPVALRDLLGEVSDLLRLMAAGKGLRLLWEADPALPAWILADRLRLRQVLFNLIGNAIKFTEQGTISVRGVAEEANATLHLLVEDTGIGIGMAHLEQIFEAFTQADESVTRRFGGTGLGLAITRHLVELMGGQIWVESQPGQGSTFHVTLPLRRAEPPAPTTAPPAPHDAPPMRILLVEDTEDNQVLIRTFLKHTPHHLTVANDGAEAVRMVRESEFDLVFMDVQMPVMDGYTATRTIRAWETVSGRPRLPIVALTAHALEGEAEHSRQAGCDQYLSKPIKKQRLLEEIGRYAPRE